jgi:hypothetical protein
MLKVERRSTDDKKEEADLSGEIRLLLNGPGRAKVGYCVFTYATT